MKKLFQFIFAFALAASLFAGSGIQAQASTSKPCFNCLANDKETLRLKNRTNGDTVWHNPISANPGDNVAFNVYYNNSSPTVIAHNTVITLSIPKDAKSRIDTYATVSADNMDPANGTGYINVNGTGMVTLQSQAYWYPDQTVSNPQLVTVTFSNQGPFTVATVDLGDIGPCWVHQGQVVFEGQLSGTPPVTPTPTPTITPTPTPSVSYVNISKTVRDVNSNTGFQKSVNANQGDQVQYSISVTAGGTTSTMGDVLVVDTLPSFVTLVSGTVRVDNQYAADNWLFSSGLNIGTMYPGQTRTIQFTATVASGIPSGTQTLTNWAKAWSNTGNIVQDSAMVFVNGYYNPTSILSLTKQSRDLTVTASNTYYNDLYTVPGRDVEFQLVVSNVGNTSATNVMLQDALPSGMTYDANSTTIDGNYTSDGIIGSGINLGTMYQGQTHTVKFRATVQQTGYFTQNTTQIVNTAYTRADNVSQIQATANVWVVKSGRVLGASTVDTGVDLAGLVTLGSTGFGSVILGAYQVARKRLLRSKIMALRQIGTV